VWVRPSTGRLCIDFTSPESDSLALPYLDGSFRPSGTSLLEIPEDLETIASISLRDYHLICFLFLSQCQQPSVSSHVSVKLGSICHLYTGPTYENPFEIAFTPDSGVRDFGWSTMDPLVESLWNTCAHPPLPYSISHIITTHGRINCNEEGTAIMEDGWIRCAFLSFAPSSRL
jgi:hypothetical protein